MTSQNWHEEERLKMWTALRGFSTPDKNKVWDWIKEHDRRLIEYIYKEIMSGMEVGMKIDSEHVYQVFRSIKENII